MSHEREQLWMRTPEDVTNEAYSSLHRLMSEDVEDHLSVRHFTVEDQLEFRAMLFMPRQAPVENLATKNNMKLDVILDAGDELIPEWLNLVVGVVASKELPLNICRETLHQHKIVRVTKTPFVKQRLEKFAEISEKRYGGREFFDTVRRVLEFWSPCGFDQSGQDC